MGYQDFETVSLVMLSFTKLVRFLQNETAVWNATRPIYKIEQSQKLPSKFSHMHENCLSFEYSTYKW